jgi:hypothetical protein
MARCRPESAHEFVDLPGTSFPCWPRYGSRCVRAFFGDPLRWRGAAALNLSRMMAQEVRPSTPMVLSGNPLGLAEDKRANALDLL